MSRPRAVVALLSMILAFPLAQADQPAQERQRAFPHNAIVARDPTDPSCRGCHGAIPEPGTPPEAAGLHMGPKGTCTMCHRGPHHSGADAHLGRIPNETLRATLPPQLTLLEDGGIACFTCHEPHLEAQVEGAPPPSPLAEELQARAATREWAAAKVRGLQLTSSPTTPPPVMVSLSLEDGRLCRACHGPGPNAGATNARSTP
jgi:hypothetical protein